MVLDTKRNESLVLEPQQGPDDDYQDDLGGDVPPSPSDQPPRVSRWLLQWQDADGVQHAMDFDNPQRAESEGEFRLRQGMIHGEFVVWRHYEEA